MADWKKLLKNLLLADGVIDADETKLLKVELMADGIIDEDEVDFLVELRNEAKEAHPDFTKFFFEALSSNILEDGIIDSVESSKLREILFADGVIDKDEKAFMVELKGKAKSVCPEFDTLLAECVK